MSQILKTNFRKSNSYIFEIQDKYILLFKPGEAADIVFNNGKVVKSSCLNCMNPMCININDCNISCKDFEQIAHEMNKSVCPVEAITSEPNSIQINENKCIGCGLCAMRCPVGAIYIRDGKAQVNIIKSEIAKPVQLNSDGIKIQDKFIDRAKQMIHEGCIQQENNTIICMIK